MSILFILKRIGFFLIDNWRAVVLTAAVLLAMFILWRAFRPAPAKLNEQEIQEAVKAAEQKNEAKLREILITAEVREKQIDDSLANAKAERVNAIADARKRVESMSAAELEAEIERLK